MGSLQEEEVSSSAARSNRLSRLEHILGGKSRKGLMRLDEGADDGKIEKETKSLNCNERGDVDEPMLEASTNSCVSDFVQCEDLGLEIAMKQLMEATHDALVNMKGEILRMQYDLERALVEISLLQQREELFQQQFKGKAFELENELSKRLEDLRQTILLEFTMCKHESEQRMIGKLESLLDEMRDIQKQCGKGEMIDPLRDKKLRFGCCSRFPFLSPASDTHPCRTTCVGLCNLQKKVPALASSSDSPPPASNVALYVQRIIPVTALPVCPCGRYLLGM